MTIADKVAAFRALHVEGAPFIIPNPWDAGSARILEGLGFKALATTSSGFALTQGRHDYGVTRDAVLSHCRDIAEAVDIPVTADLENGFGAEPETAAETILLAAETGLVGGSIEDSTGDKAAPVFDQNLAIERVAAAVEAARKSESGFVLTARAEAFLYDGADLDEVIARLKGFEDAGADVLFAPGLSSLEAVREVCAALEKPVNVLAYGPLREATLEDFANAGAARISVGGALGYGAYGALIETATRLAGGELAAVKLSPAAKAVGEHLR